MTWVTWRQHRGQAAVSAALLVIPGLVGVVIGAPLLGRELEQGTWRMAWSQTVPRTRWLVTKLTLVTGGLVILGAAMTVLFTWYRTQMDQITGHFTEAAFDFEGLSLTASLLCAFAFAVLAGLLTRRSIAAMVAAFPPWAVLRGVDDFFLRARFASPLTEHRPAGTHIMFGPNVTSMTGHPGDWVLGACAGPVAAASRPRP